MTQIYCTKCRGFTDTKSEDFVTTKNGRIILTGICKVCNTKKNTFVNDNLEFYKKDENELKKARTKRHNRTKKKKTLAIGKKILDNKNTTKCVKACFPKTKKELKSV